MACTDRYPIRSQAEVLEVRTGSYLLEEHDAAHKGGTQRGNWPHCLPDDPIRNTGAGAG